MSNLTFNEIVRTYLDSKNHTSKERDYYSLRHLNPFFDGRYLENIKRADIRAYIISRQKSGVQDSTINRELRFLSAAINFAALELEITLRNPVRSMMLKIETSRIRWITHEEAKRLITAAQDYERIPHLSCFIRLALNTGCRKPELLMLEWSRVDLNTRLLTFESKHNKSRKLKTVPLNPSAIDALIVLRAWTDKNYPASPFVFTSQKGKRIVCFKRGFTAACKLSGITNFRIHDMRHTCASWLVMSGVSLMVVRDLLGHSSVTVTEIYAHLSPRQVQAAVDSLPVL